MPRSRRSWPRSPTIRCSYRRSRSPCRRRTGLPCLSWPCLFSLGVVCPPNIPLPRRAHRDARAALGKGDVELGAGGEPRARAANVPVGAAHDAVAASEHARGIEVGERIAQRREVARAIGEAAPCRARHAPRDARELAPLALDALRGREQPAREPVHALRARLEAAPQIACEAPPQSPYLLEQRAAVGA